VTFSGRSSAAQGVEPPAGFERQLGRDKIGAGAAQKGELVGEPGPREVVLVADKHQQPPTPPLQRGGERLQIGERVGRASMQRHDQLRPLDRPPRRPPPAA
jgi:hypothetical protein